MKAQQIIADLIPQGIIGTVDVDCGNGWKRTFSSFDYKTTDALRAEVLDCAKNSQYRGEFGLRWQDRITVFETFQPDEDEE